MRELKEILEKGKIWGHEISAPLLHAGFIHLPDCGSCSVAWCDNEHGMEHVSVAPKRQFKIPSRDDMCVLKDIFFEDGEEVYQIHPRKSEYVGIKENCLHLWKPCGHELRELVEKQMDAFAYNEMMIRDFLEKCYIGARMEGDEDMKIRTARALLAFDFDIEDELFLPNVTEKFIAKNVAQARAEWERLQKGETHE